MHVILSFTGRIRVWVCVIVFQTLRLVLRRGLNRSTWSFINSSYRSSSSRPTCPSPGWLVEEDWLTWSWEARLYAPFLCLMLPASSIVYILTLCWDERPFLDWFGTTPFFFCFFLTDWQRVSGTASWTVWQLYLLYLFIYFSLVAARDTIFWTVWQRHWFRWFTDWCSFMSCFRACPMASRDWHVLNSLSR